MTTRFIVALAFLAAALSCTASRAAQTLSETSVGRFGAGHNILPSTANQDLLAWNVVNSGRDIETRVYDADGKPLSLGRCGFAPAQAGEATEVKNAIDEVSWTGLTSTYTRGTKTLRVRESLLTPALWFQSSANRLTLFQPDPTPQDLGPVVESIALPLAGGVRIVPASSPILYSRERDGDLTRPWFLALVRRGAYRVPVLCLLHASPVEMTQAKRVGLTISSGIGLNAFGLLPLYGCRPMPAARTAGWERAIPPEVVRRADRLAERFYARPKGVEETYRITDREVRITNTVTFDDRPGEFGWTKRWTGRFAPAPPALENARRYGYPVRYAQKVEDLDYPTFLGPLVVVPGERSIGGKTTITYSLPRPRLYETLTSPFADPATEAILPEPVTRTIRDYSKYVVKTYANKTDWMYEKSAVGEGRILGSEYPCLRMMDAPARKAFTAWADRAAATHLYNWPECYGWGEEKTNGRRFYLDNYRFGADYMDAGWFGYNVLAMWARSHYGGRWDEARKNWPKIRDLFYGWNWVYSDYAAMYSPLYVDGVNGGSAKGYTDNQSMLPALYGWARMADRLGDRATFTDALYMLARDRVARYNRMAIHDYTRHCGYNTDVYWLTSDMGNGPNISPTGRFIPPDPDKWKTGALVNYGDKAVGLWFLTGSFLEPVTPETIDLMREGGMAARVADTVALIDRRFPRWWASPGAGEMANYQIYLRGALLKDDPTFLRYCFDYQDGFQQGVWTAEPWHADAFAGIFLSRLRPLPAELSVRDGVGWRPSRGEVEAHLLLGKDDKPRLSLYNATPTSLTVRLQPERGAAVQRTLAPGANLFAYGGPAVDPPVRRNEIRPDLLPLPAVVALLETPGEKLVRAPKVGTAEITAYNRRSRPADLRFAWAVDGRQVAERTLTVPAGQGATWKIPLEDPSLAPGRYGFTATLTGDGIDPATRSRDIVLLTAPGQKAASPWITLYGFERSIEEWFLPDWPDANKGADGKVAPLARTEEKASEGKGSLRTTLNVAAGKQSRAFLSVHPYFDWTPFRCARLDVYLPPDAPAGLTAGFYMMGDGWRWREATRRTPLMPGKWTTVEIALAGPESAADWKQTAEDIQTCLKNVLDIGISIQNAAPDFVPYRGTVFVDDLRAELR